MQKSIYIYVRGNPTILWHITDKWFSFYYFRGKERVGEGQRDRENLKQVLCPAWSSIQSSIYDPESMT